MRTLILLFQCRDQRGIVARVSDFIFRQGGNIITADQHTTDPRAGHFFMRVEFALKGDKPAKRILEKELAKLARPFKASFGLYDKKEKLRMGIMASRPDHCLLDLMYLWRSQELNVEIPFVVSNYIGNRELVEQFNVPFYFIPATRQNRKESQIFSLALKEADFLVLARYMLVLSGKFLREYTGDIINIHHGFLPSFRGANPYKQALKKGVKVIGATAHFVSGRLDEGPIIAQAVESVSHKDSLEDLIRKGKNLEKHALAEAVTKYIDRRIIKYADKTIVF